MAFDQLSVFILSGGSGSRLWPLSRKAYPKQFLPLMEGESLFEQTVRRFIDAGAGKIAVIANDDHRFLAERQAKAAGCADPEILLEPVGRNTAAAAAAAALTAHRGDPNAVVILAPSDHTIDFDDRFTAAIAAGMTAAEAGSIVTFGIYPDKPETGYGYVEIADVSVLARQAIEPVDVVRFVEKPDRDTAQGFIDSGRFVWNAGVFLFRAETMIAALDRFAPDVLSAVTAALDAAERDLGFRRLDEAAFSRAPAISLDYAVIEKADNVAMVPLYNSWSDLGSWDKLWSVYDRDDAGNALIGDVSVDGCSDSLILTDGPCVAALGVEGHIIVATKDVVTVLPMHRAQSVRDMVDRFKAEGRSEAEFNPKDYRPWGWFEDLSIGPRFRVKRIFVSPGHRLSLQSHAHRSEHWVVVSGTARVQVDDRETLLGENESVYIPLGAKHRLENPGKIPLELIEVQSGAYLGEDDIVRYADDYARSKT